MGHSSWFYKFTNSYALTNIFALVLFIIITIAAIIIETVTKKRYKFTSKRITFYAALISVVVIFNTVTIWISKFSLPQQYEYRPGDIIVIIPGMLFGPVAGVLCALISDHIALITTNNTGVYHFGFTMEACLTGFMGGLIFTFANKKNWFILTAIVYALILGLNELFLTPIWLASEHIVPLFVSVMPGLIMYAIKLPTYILIFYPIFYASYEYVKKAFFSELWCNRKDDLQFYIKKNSFKKIHKNKFITNK